MGRGGHADQEGVGECMGVWAIGVCYLSSYHLSPPYLSVCRRPELAHVSRSSESTRLPHSET